jgi:hypothetical protein
MMLFNNRPQRPTQIGARIPRYPSSCDAVTEYLPNDLLDTMGRLYRPSGFDPAEQIKQLDCRNVAMGRSPIHGNTSRSNRLITVSEWLGAKLGENFSNHSRATLSKQLSSRRSVVTCAALAALRAALGSIPDARSRRASSPVAGIL